MAFVVLAVSHSVGSAAEHGSLAVSTDFPGGSGAVQSIDAAAGVVHIQPAFQKGRGWPCWWYLRLDGLQVGRPLTLKVSAYPRPYRYQRVLSPSWSQPERAMISSDNTAWVHTPRRRSEGRVAVYRFPATAETMWVAWGPPFLPSHAESLLKRVASASAEAELFELAMTRGGRPVRGIRLGGGTQGQPARFGVWVQARQHAWEAGSSWVGRGFIEWAAGDSPAAVQLRRSAAIHYVPIMDVDNVAAGAGGKEAVPRDHNRDWSDQAIYPEVVAAQTKILELDQSGRLDVFIDLHNPGPSEQRPYFFGPMDLGDLPAIQQRNHRRWLAICRDTISGPMPLEPLYKFATYVKTAEERNRMSANWVRTHTGHHLLATTLETAWNTPNSTQEGYMAVGRQLAQSVARYLEKDPRRQR